MEEEDQKQQAGYSDKMRILEFFQQKNYRMLTSYHHVNESDLVESILNVKRYYRKQGYITALALSFFTWDTLLRRNLPISKLALGVVMFRGFADLNVYTHLDELYEPLNYIFEKYYKDLIEKPKET